MKAAYLIHEVVLKSERLAPSSVIELDDDTFAELETLGAVREATDAEAGFAVPQSKPAEPAKKAAAKTGKKETKADADAAAKAQADADATVKAQADADAAAAAADTKPDSDPDVAAAADADLLDGK